MVEGGWSRQEDGNVADARLLFGDRAATVKNTKLGAAPTFAATAERNTSQASSFTTP